MNMHRTSLRLLLGLLVVLLSVASCGDEATPTPIVVIVTPPSPESQSGAVAPTVTLAPTSTPAPPEAAAETDIEILEATFAHGLSEAMVPEDPGADFAPTETVYLSLKVKGRPEDGVVTARFYWHEDLIAEAGVDLSDVNSGVIFSIGEDTYLGYTLTHEEPFPLSDRYLAEVFFGDQPLGTYPFRVVAPPDAIATQISQVTLALGADENYEPVEPTTTFASNEEVHLVGEGDLGTGTWLQADWYVSGQLDNVGTRSLTLEENIPGAGFVFSFLPEGGWPLGEHFVVLTVNDQEIGRYTFTIVSPGSAAPKGEVGS
jgi:hypothetical protein